ncbi:L-2-hydroxyglutarate oxidase LhgO [Klebsiella pneumoniae]|nr:L-2-hydroxyglutarate oxidase LhgO [Klebsiella pneumoniae]
MYDFVIIGGGIIGMSTAMQLIEIYPDARIALLEKEAGPACHQTGHNSGVIHAGVYARQPQGAVLPRRQPRHQGLLRAERHPL